jgi:hypothetical protein
MASPAQLGTHTAVIVVVIGSLSLTPTGCTCPGSEPAKTVTAGASAGADHGQSMDEVRPSSLQPSPREPGPPREEPAEQLERARAEARAWTRTLAKGDFSRREAASIADIRGYRLFRKRYFGQARVWFEEATRLDPTFEPALFHAARTAALLGDVAGARRHLARLRGLGTPMSRRQLEISAHHADFAVLRAAADR